MTTTTATTPVTVKEMVARINELVFDSGIDLRHICKNANIKWSKNPSKQVAIDVLALVEKRHARKVSLQQQIYTLGGGTWYMPKFTTKEMMDEVSRLTALEEAKSEALATSLQEQAPIEVAQEEEVTMTNNTTNQVVTVEYMNGQMMEMMDGFMTILNNTMEAQSKQISSTLAEMDVRMDKASRYTKSLENRIAVLSGPSAQVAVTTPEPTTEGPIQEVAPIEGGNTVNVNMDEVVFTEEQIKAIENMEKKVGKEGAKQVKETFENMNRRLGHTVGNILNGTSKFLDEKGHMGVDSVADLVGKTIDSAKAITVALIDLTSTTLHSANEIGRTAGHIIINGTVYTLDAAGNMVTKKN